MFNKYLQYAQLPHHEQVTILEHSINVTLKMIELNEKFKLEINEDSIKLVGMFHDNYQYNWRTTHLHGHKHPFIAAKNSEAFGLNHKELRAIKTHMWPYNIWLIPNSKLAWLLNVSDKICSAKELGKKSPYEIVKIHKDFILSAAIRYRTS